jgi:hypothetical protein
VDLAYHRACRRDVLRRVQADHQNFVLRWRCVVDDHLAVHGHFFRGGRGVAGGLQNFVLHCVVDDHLVVHGQFFRGDHGVAGGLQSFALHCVVDDHPAEHGHFFWGDHDVAGDPQSFALHCVADGRGPPDVHLLAVYRRSRGLHREAVGHLMRVLLRSVAVHQSPDGFPVPVAAQCERVQTNVPEVLAQDILLRLQHPWVGGPCMDVRYQHAAADHQTRVSHDVVGDHRTHAARAVLAARLWVVDHQSWDVHSVVAARLHSVQDDHRSLVCRYVVYY